MQFERFQMSRRITPISIRPGTLSLDELHTIYRSAGPVVVESGCRRSVEESAKVVMRAAAGDAAVYGVNTGFGKLAQTRIASSQTAKLQRNLILSHCCGVGTPLSPEVVRLIMALKINSLGRGASGVRWEVIQQLELLLAENIIPVVPSQGSVGASGDLAPLAHIAAVMIGEGEAEFNGEVVDAGQALGAVGIAPLVLGPKEGLALINGTQVSTALALVGLFDAFTLACSALITGAMACDALMGSSTPFRHEIHRLRGHVDQLEAARLNRELRAF